MSSVQVATNVSIGGHSYNVWEGAQSTWNTVSYTMTSGTTSVSNLDVGQLAQDAINRGYMPSSCWLIDVEAGFELWQGGAGLATNSFSVNVNGALSSWSVGWTFPGSQQITNMWNASYTQSGQSVTAHNAPYNGTLAPGTSTTFGFTATGSNTPPASPSCT